MYFSLSKGFTDPVSCSDKPSVRVVKDAHRGLANQRAAFCDVTTLNEVGIRGFVWNKLCKFMRFAIQDGGP